MPREQRVLSHRGVASPPTHPAQLTPQERCVLHALAHPRFRGAHLPVWRIVEALDMPSTGQAVANLLRRLERRGYVTSRLDPRGRRWWAVSPA